MSGRAAAMLVCLPLGLTQACAEPLAVRAAVASAASACVAEGGRPTPGPWFSREVDINGDHVPDWILDYSSYACRGARGGNPFCGPLGCRVQVLLSNDQRRFEPAFDGRASAWRIRSLHGKQRFQVARVAAYCGASAGGGCSETYEPQGAKLALVAKDTDSFRRARDVAATAASGAGPRPRTGPAALDVNDPGDGIAPPEGGSGKLATYPVSQSRLNEIRLRQKRLRLPVQ